MSDSPAQPYLHPEPDAVQAFAARAMEGELVMLNLLRFRDVADYSDTPELASATPISGRDAYSRYIDHTLPHLRESGGDILFLGEGGQFLIGPEDERWDRMILVQHGSIQAFMSFATNEAYLSGVGHRTAALEDSRLLPMDNLRRHV